MQFEKRHSDQKILVEQFVYINNATVHDDGPDASEMAINYLQKGSGVRVTDAIPAFAGCSA